MQGEINLLPKTISGFPLYSITPNGDVYSAFKGSVKQLRPCKDSSGYLAVSLFTGSKRRHSFKVHKLVALTFIGEAPGASYQIDHIDGNKLNNHYTNLRWITQSANILKKYREDGHKTHFAKPVVQKNLNGEVIAKHQSGLDAAKQIGGDSSAISKVCLGKMQTHRGFIWEYV